MQRYAIRHTPQNHDTTQWKIPIKRATIYIRVVKQRIAISNCKCYSRAMSQAHIPQVVLFYDISHNITRQTINGVLRYANTNAPWFLTLSDISATPILPKGCSGIVVCEPTAGQLKQLMKFKLPLVVIDYSRYKGEAQRHIEKLPHVKSEAWTFGVRAAEYYLSQAPRTFAYIGAIGSPDWSRERGEAFAARIQMDGHESYMYHPEKNESPTSRKLVKWLKKLPKPLSIFAANDERAQQVLQICQLAGIVVPHEAKLLGVDNDKWFCESSHPRLSSIPFNSEECGFEAALILDKLMQDTTPENLSTSLLKKIIPPGEVIERESTEDRTVNDPVVDKALSFIHFKRGLNIRATDVSKATGFALNRLEKHFRKTLGVSLISEISKVRMKTVLQLVRETNTPVIKIAQLCGFTNASTLCRLIKKETGQAIRDLRQKTTHDETRHQS